MPKGKGKGKAKGKGDKKGGELPPPPKVEEAPVDELSKQFYLVQIKDLEERLARYQDKCDKLELSNDELGKKLRQQLEDQEEMIVFLKKKSQKQSEQYVDMEEKLAVVQQAREKERERFEQQYAQLKEDSQRALDQAAVENRVLQGQLESLEDFRLNKEKLEANMKKMEELLVEQKREYEDTLYRLEKKGVLDKDRLKREMITKLNSVAEEFRKVSDLQMAETTKRTIRENVSINQQLAKMSDKTIDLIRENEALRMRECKLKRQVEILEANERELTKRNVTNRKVLVMLKEQNLEQQREMREVGERAKKSKQLELAMEEEEKRVQASQKDLEALRSKVAYLEKELADFQHQVIQNEKELQQLRAVIARSSQAIHSAIQPSFSEDDEIMTRDQLLLTLLQLLSSSTDTSTLQYKPGDLGLIPPCQTGHPKRPSSHNRITGTQLPPLGPGGRMMHTATSTYN